MALLVTTVANWVILHAGVREKNLEIATRRSKTHSDRMCHRKARNRLDKVNQACEAAYYSHDGVRASFAHKTSAHIASQEQSRKPDTLLVKCGATAHVISDESKFTKFDNT